MSLHTLKSKFHTVILHSETYFISTVRVRVCLLRVSTEFRMPVPRRSLSILIKSNGKESLRTSATSFFYILHKITLTNVTFSFNSVTITKVKLKVQVS
jgi:hypothetical protein